MIYTMMQACKEMGMTYQGLNFYCNEGLIVLKLKQIITEGKEKLFLDVKFENSGTNRLM